MYHRPHTFSLSVADKKAHFIRFHYNVGTAALPSFEKFTKRAEMVLLKDLNTGTFYNVLRPPPSWATLIPKEI